MTKISFEQLRAILIDNAIAFEIMDHAPVFTMEDVVRELDIPENEMAKTLLMVISGKGLCRVVIPGMAHLNLKKLAEVLSVTRKDIQLASKESVEEAGFTIGAIPPFGAEIPTYIDDSFLKQDILYCGAGDNSKTFSLKPKDVITLTKAFVVQITEQPHN